MSTNQDVVTKIKKARLSLLFNQPFFGSLIMQMPLVEADDWCPTAAVDGRYTYWNRKFFEGLTLDEVIFVLAHEVMHVVYDHLGRRGHRDPGYWNMAGDYVINAMLQNEKIGAMPTRPVPVKDGEGNTSQRVGLYDKRYEGWTSEAVYDDLQKRKVTKQMTLDVHLELGKDGQDGEGKKQMQGPNGKGIPVQVSDEDLKKIREELKNKVLQAAQAAQSQGKLPAGIARMVDMLVEAKINWRDYILQSIQSQLTADYAWHKPNRRHMGSDVIFPSLIKEDTIDVEITIDQSGSISKEMARDFLSEIHGITQQYNNFTIGVSTFDTRLYNRQVFNSENVDELLDYEPKGGGGTDFNSFWNFYKKHDIQPKLLIVFTDLECDDHGPRDYCDQVIWVVNNPYNKKILPDFGTWVRYERDVGVTEVGAV
jgi:predicted metal-dependent peptidase